MWEQVQNENEGRRSMRLAIAIVIAAAVIGIGAPAAAQEIELVGAGFSGDPADANTPMRIERFDVAMSSDAGRVTYSDATFDRLTDLATPRWFVEAVSGRALATFTVNVYEPDPASPGGRRLIESYLLREPLVTGWQVEFVDGFTAVETLAVDFTAIYQCTYTYGADEMPVESCFGWDVQRNDEWIP